MSKSFVQVPPQSTGKRIATELRAEIFFDNLTGEFNVGDTVVGASSGAFGVVTGIRTEGYVAGSGELYLRNVSGTFTNNEALEVNNIQQASVDFGGGKSQIEYDLQKVIITDPNNIDHNQKIDRFGATINTFTDGSPVFGPFGTLTTGEPMVIKTYQFGYSDMSEDFYDQTIGTSSVTRNPGRGVINLSTGTSNGDFVSRTSHFYHPYIPGIGNQLVMTIQTGDAGKTGVTRRWGAFDDNNGVFFQLEGTTLSVVLRSKSGDGNTVIDNVVTQENFNVDQLDGSDSIGFNLDTTKGNIYWIDYQWLGAGRIRFGVFEPSGAKLVAHVIENANIEEILPYSQSGSLPLKLEQFNTADVVSTSELTMACAVFQHTSKVSLKGDRHSSSSGLVSLATSDGEVPIYSIRPKTTFGGRPNHGTIKGISVDFANHADDGNGAIVYRVRSCTNGALTGESYVEHKPSSIAEEDFSATAIDTAQTHLVLTKTIMSNQSELLTDSTVDNPHDFEIFLYADEVTQPCFVVTAEVVTGNTAFAQVNFNWEERIY